MKVVAAGRTEGEPGRGSVGNTGGDVDDSLIKDLLKEHRGIG